MRFCFDRDSIIQSLQEEEERPRVAKLMIISASKAENKKKMAQICCL